MAKPTRLTLGELKRLLTDLDSGVHDDRVVVLPGTEPASAQKVADVKPFGVRAWTERSDAEVRWRSAPQHST